MKNKKLFIWILVLVLCSFSVFAGYYNLSVPVNNSGYVTYDLTDYRRRANENISLGFDNTFGTYRGFIDFNLSNIPFDSKKLVFLFLNVTRNDTKTDTVIIYELEDNSSEYNTGTGTGGGNNLLYNDIKDGTQYLSTSDFSLANSLGANAIIDIQNHSSWFSVGFSLQTETNALNVFLSNRSSNISARPYLILVLDNISSEINIVSPANNAINDSNSAPTIRFEYNVSDDSAINNCTIFINNSNRSFDTGVSKNVEKYFNFSLGFGSYNWSITCFDAYNNSNSTLNRTLTVQDSSPPGYDTRTSSTTSSSGTVSWNTNESTNATLYYSTDSANIKQSSVTSAAFEAFHSFTINSLAASTTFFYNISFCDTQNNCYGNETFTFTTAAAASSGSGSTGGDGGGGGGGSPPPSGGEAEAEAEAEAESESEAEAEAESEPEPQPEPEQPKDLPIDKSILQAIEFTAKGDTASRLFHIPNGSNFSNEFIDVKRDFIFNNETNQTEIVVIITPKTTLVNFTYYERIPKCIALLIKNNVDIKFKNNDFEIIEDDPLIGWHFKRIEAGETIDLSYTVNKQLLDDCKKLLESLGIASFEEPTSLFRSLLNFLKKTGASIVGLDLFEDGKLSEAGSIVFSLALTFFIVVFVIGLEKIKPEIDKKGFKQAMKDLELHRKIREHTKHWFSRQRDWFEELKRKREQKKLTSLVNEKTTTVADRRRGLPPTGWRLGLFPKEKDRLPPRRLLFFSVERIKNGFLTKLRKITSTKEVPKGIAPQPIEVVKPITEQVKSRKPFLFPKISSFFVNLKKNAIERTKEKERIQKKKQILKKKLESGRKKAKQFESKWSLLWKPQAKPLQKKEIKKIKPKKKPLTVDEAISQVEHQLKYYDRVMSKHKGLFANKLRSLDRKIKRI